MDFLIPKYRRDPNEKVESLYWGVASGNRTMVSLVKPSVDRNKLEANRTFGSGLPRGQGGRIGILVLGGMETTLDEMEYILAESQAKRFVPRKSGHEIADMCHLLQDRRNERLKWLRKNPSEMPKKRPVRLHLPVGVRYMPTPEPGLRILATI